MRLSVAGSGLKSEVNAEGSRAANVRHWWKAEVRLLQLSSVSDREMKHSARAENRCEDHERDGPRADNRPISINYESAR